MISRPLDAQRRTARRHRFRLSAWLLFAALGGCSGEWYFPGRPSTVATVLDASARRTSASPARVEVTFSGTVDSAVCVRLVGGRVSVIAPDTIWWAAGAEPEQVACAGGDSAGTFTHTFLADAIESDSVVLRVNTYNSVRFERRLAIAASAAP